LDGKQILRISLAILLLSCFLAGQEEMPYNKLAEELGCGNCNIERFKKIQKNKI
jgi:hypothetical protein|tara:strand:- start:497 stop:658 length:162 start_codon:yes stop_codon:yes gene_type:complete